MKKLEQLNEYLFTQIEELTNDDLNENEFKRVVEKSNTLANISDKIIKVEALKQTIRRDKWVTGVKEDEE